MTVALSTSRLNGTLVPAPAGGLMNSARPPASAIDDATFVLVPSDLTSLFQPIMSFASGRIEGFETLARLKVGDALLQPPAFLPVLGHRGSIVLFEEMLRQAGELLECLPAGLSTAYVSVNVEASLLLVDAFGDAVRRFSARHGASGRQRLVLEILESHAIADIATSTRRLSELRAQGIRIALDDLGSAYASLNNLRDLPADIVKLDHSFAFRLSRQPRNLALILGLQSLTTNLGKRLVVEGVESQEAYDALRMLGVDLGQGFFIAEPMPRDAILRWSASPAGVEIGRDPTSLLGAYASHLRVTEACRVLTQQPLPVSWTKAMQDPHACAIGRFFDRFGLHDTEFGHAHKVFHSRMDLCRIDRSAWQGGAELFRDALETAIKAVPGL